MKAKCISNLKSCFTKFGEVYEVEAADPMDGYEMFQITSEGELKGLLFPQARFIEMTEETKEV